MLKVSLIGNLGADAVVKRDNDREYIAMSVAHSVKTTNSQTGEVVETTQWLSVTFNRSLGGLLPLLRRGVKVYVRGNLSSRLYVGHDGRQHAGLNVYGENIELLTERITADKICQFINDCTDEERWQVVNTIQNHFANVQMENEGAHGA